MIVAHVSRDEGSFVINRILRQYLIKIDHPGCANINVHAHRSCVGSWLMPHKHPDPEVALKARELLDIHDGEGLTVTCINGVVWITQSEDTRDIIVAAGQSFILDRPGLALVAAPVGPATITVRAATCNKPTRAAA
jgi:Protein of unknown function (DUF2917)